MKKASCSTNIVYTSWYSGGMSKMTALKNMTVLFGLARNSLPDMQLRIQASGRERKRLVLS